jgi:3-hydroxymyristoyl/3-hydroxydecanoyl-(acyl carrier protein) dehydratase
MLQYRFVDRILQVDASGAGTITTQMTFPKGADYFDGTFRLRDEVPASLLLESMAFAGSILLCIRSGYTAQGVLLKVNRASFDRRIAPDEPVTISASLAAIQGEWRMGADSEAGGALAQVLCQCRVEGQQVAEGDLMFLGVPVTTTLGSRKDGILDDIREMVRNG